MIQIRRDYNKSRNTQATGHSAEDVIPESVKRQKRSHSDLTPSTVCPMDACSSGSMGTTSNQNNVFNILQDDVNDIEVVPNLVPNKTTRTIGSKVFRCPPVTVTGLSTKHLRELFSTKEIPQDKYNMKAIKNGLQLIVSDKEHFLKAVDALKTAQVEYFTYMPSEDVPVKIILSGLPLFELVELKAELKHYDVQPAEVKVFSVRKNSLEDNVLYLLEFRKGQVKLQDLRKVKALFNTIVSWRYFVKNKQDVVQCHRCQRYGHGKSSCNMLPLCVKCGDRHETIQCKLPVKAKLQDKDKSDRSQVKCANCSGNHTANFRGCPVRNEYLKQLEEREMRRRTLNSERHRRYQTSNEAHQQFTTRSQQSGGRAQGNQQLYSDVVRINNQTAPQNEDPTSNLFSLSEFLSLARELFQRLRECRNKEQQFLALSELMIKYVYNV